MMSLLVRITLICFALYRRQLVYDILNAQNIFLINMIIPYNVGYAFFLLLNSE